MSRIGSRRIDRQMTLNGNRMKLHAVRPAVSLGDLAPSDHLCQIYDDDDIFMNALEGFVAGGLRAGESVIVIASAGHLHELEQRLRSNWLDLDRARWEDRYVALLAAATLSKFMVDGCADEDLFR